MGRPRPDAGRAEPRTASPDSELSDPGGSPRHSGNDDDDACRDGDADVGYQFVATTRAGHALGDNSGDGKSLRSDGRCRDDA